MNWRACNPINIVYSCMLALNTILMAFYPIVKATVFESYLMYGLWGTVFLLVFLCFAYDLKAGTKNGFGLYVLIIALLLYNVFFAEKFSSELIIAALNFFVMLFPFYYTQHMRKSMEQVRFIEHITIIHALIYISYFLSPYAYSGFYVEGTYIKNGQLTLGYSNPNTTAIYLFCTFSTLLCLLKVKKEDSKIKKLGVTFMLIALAYLIICTGSRLETGCMIVVVLLRVLGINDMIKNVLTSRFFIMIMIMLPILFLCCYFSLSTIVPSGYTVMGRGLFARITIYQKAIASLQSNIWLGDMQQWLFTNSHNALLTIAVNLGLVGLVAYLIFLYKNMERYSMYVKINKSANIIPYFMMFSFLIQGCAEAASLTGGISFMSGMAVATYLNEVNDNGISKGIER